MGMRYWGVKAHHNRLLPKRNNDEDNDEHDDDEDDDEVELLMPNGGNVRVPCWAAAYFSSSYASHCSPLLCHAHLALNGGKRGRGGAKGGGNCAKSANKAHSLFGFGFGFGSQSAQQSAQDNVLCACLQVCV